MQSAKYSLILPSNQNEVSKVEQLVEQCASEHNFSEDLHGTLAIVITELFNNAIIHGNGCDESKKAALFIEISASEISVRITDEGVGFESSGVPNPLDESNLEKAGGRGIFIVEHMMDSVEHINSENGHEVVAKIARSVNV